MSLPVESAGEWADTLILLNSELLGAENYTVGQANEILPQRPSTWYLTGFLVPLDAAPEQRIDQQNNEEIDELSDSPGLDDAVAPEPAAARVRYLPSSMGVSVLIPEGNKTLKVMVRWGDYRSRRAGEDEPRPFIWERTGREEAVEFEIPDKTQQPNEIDVPQSAGLRVAVSVRPRPRT